MRPAMGSRVLVRARGGQRVVGLISCAADFVLVVLLATSRVYAQAVPEPGAEVWDRLGCWNCHGSNGYTNMSSAGRPSIARTALPLRRFVGQVRLPLGRMPPHVPWLAPDAELTLAYHWLGGVDAVAPRSAVILALEPSPEGKAYGRAAAWIDVGITALRAKTAPNSGVLDLASLNYRVTLITNSKLAVVDRTLEYRPAGREKWSTFTLNGDGEALLGKDRHFVTASGTDPGRAGARLRIPIPTVPAVVVIEALAQARSARPVILGIGTVILRPATHGSRTDH